MLINVYLEMV